MLNRSFTICVALTLAFTIAGSAPARSNADRSDRNVGKMIEAAEQMELYAPGQSENRPYFLVKRETVRAVVGIIFGYGSNKAACDEIVAKLSRPITIGTFECATIEQIAREFQ